MGAIKASLCKSENIWITKQVFSDHIGIKLETQEQKNLVKSPTT